MLLKDAETGPAVHMLRRRASMAFAGGAYAYPGGGVDPRDDDHHVHWAGTARAWWADRLGVAETEAQAIVCAAVRETYEEAGVLLAGPDRDSVVGDTTGPDWEADRAALVARDLSFAEFLERRGLVLVRICWVPGHAGSPRSSNPAATTPGSSWPRFPRASAPGTPPRRRTVRCGSDRPRRRRRTTRASC
ncbi:hypothetical protein SALBM311S_00983 [Streptomyces alboniger]